MDFETGTPAPAHAVVEWAQCGSHQHVKVSVGLPLYSSEELTAVTDRIADRVPGFRTMTVARSIFGATLEFWPTPGNSTVDGAKWVLDRLAEALNLALTVDVREREDLLLEDILALLAGLGLNWFTYYPYRTRRRPRWGDGRI
jgi:hypothetical protein